jgi:preprotein translocase subunit SecE
MPRYKRLIQETIAGVIVTAGMAGIFYILAIGIGG